MCVLMAPCPLPKHREYNPGPRAVVPALPLLCVGLKLLMALGSGGEEGKILCAGPVMETA